MTPAAAPRPSLFVATPTCEGIALSPYVQALADMLGRLHAAGVATVYRLLDGRDLTAQRETLVEAFLASDCTHLLFVDADMAFPADLALRLLAFDKPLIGTVYTKRALDLRKLATLLDRHPFRDALPLAYEWNVRVLDRSFTVQNGLTKVEGLGGGFLLIKREVFETMRARLGQEVAHGFFGELRAGDQILDLDYAFCRRWIGCGGDVWAYVDPPILHVGDYRASEPLATFLKAIGSFGPPHAAAPS